MISFHSLMMMMMMMTIPFDDDSIPFHWMMMTNSYDAWLLLSIRWWWPLLLYDVCLLFDCIQFHSIILQYIHSVVLMCLLFHSIILVLFSSLVVVIASGVCWSFFNWYSPSYSIVIHWLLFFLLLPIVFHSVWLQFR